MVGRSRKSSRYFLRSEDNDTLSGEWHGVGGPLGVSSLAPPHRLTRAFVQACQQYGMPYNPDFNGPRQEGTARVPDDDAECAPMFDGYGLPSTSAGPLQPRGNDRTRSSVASSSRKTAPSASKSSKEAVRSWFAPSARFSSPPAPSARRKLMLLSGLGPADELRALGLPVVADLPGVGRNLHDHFGIDIVYELSGPYSLDKYAKPHWMVWAGLEYLIFGKGPVTSNVVEGGAFWYGDRSSPVPDLQFHFLIGAGVEAGVPKIPSGSGVTLNSYTLRPKARGSVKLRSADFSAMPIVDPNFLGDPYDLRISVEGIKISRDVLKQSAMSRFIRKEHFPGNDVRTQADFENYARQFGRTSYHPVGTCRMGIDAEAVVDPELRVRGVNGLRICDSSVMPRVVGSNTNAASIMIGEKASSMILGNA